MISLQWRLHTKTVCFLDLHIFTLGFVVTSQQMWILCLWYGLCWRVLRGFSRHFNSPPDLTPFALDKHNTMGENEFYVRGLVITCRKRGLSESPGKLYPHKSSSNESFLSKQGAKTNWTWSPSPDLTLILHSPLPLPGRNFYEERRDEVVEDYAGAKRHIRQHQSFSLTRNYNLTLFERDFKQVPQTAGGRLQM